MRYLFLIILLFPCLFNTLQAQATKDSFYHAKTSSAATQMIPVYNGKYKVFTQKIGNGKIKLLLLHGGPENTHEYFENFPEKLKQLGVTIYFYDQLGSYYSDTPDDSTIWNMDRFVEEVEEVRKGLKLDDFYLLGHSWGGMLAELYAAKYGDHIKGVILSNVPGFFSRDPQYLSTIIDSIGREVRRQTVQLPMFSTNRSQADSISRNMPLQDTVKSKLLSKQFNKANDSLFARTMYYRKTGKMPEPLMRNMKHARFESIEKYHFNPFDADYRAALMRIKTPTLLLGAKNDFLQPEFYHTMKEMMKQTVVKVYICPNGAHFPMWDDDEHYFSAIDTFINEVEKGILK